MTNPCETCLERDFYEDTNLDRPCRRRQAYDNWKEKAKEIREHTKEVMRRAKDGGQRFNQQKRCN